MLFYSFQNDQIFPYHMCGKFSAPDEQWRHMARSLEDYELMVVLEGTLYIADDRQQYTVNAGEYLLMAPTKHQYGTKSSRCKFYWMHFGWLKDQIPRIELVKFIAKDQKENIFQDGTRLVIPVQNKLRSVDRVVILMKQLQDSAQRYHQMSLNNSLTTAVINEIACQSDLFTEYNQQFKKNQLCHDIENYIAYHTNMNLTVAQVAAHFGYNEKYLSTAFKKISGITLKKYMIQRRMEQAMKELTDTNLTVAQIGEHAGFEDAHNFSNAFKKATGLSPGKYRESYSHGYTVF